MKEKVMNGINGIEGRFKKFKTVFTREKWDDVDDMFFSFEPLPKRGKEYWFLFLTSTESRKGAQLLVMLGDQNVGEFRVDGEKITRKVHGESRLAGVHTAWYYRKRAVYLPTSPAVIEMGSGKVRSEGGGIELTFSGKYPRYRLRLADDGKEVCSVGIRGPRSGKLYDMFEYFRGGLGFGNVNLYLDFEGKLKGTEFRGRCYLQKVAITAPLPSVPWHWGRIYFHNGSVFQFMHPYFSLSRLRRKFATSAYFYDADRKERHDFRKVDVLQFGSKEPHFLVHVESAYEEMTIMLKPYATKRFTIDSIGRMSYDEHLVQVTSMSAERSGNPMTFAGLGNGVGLVEDGRGLVI